MSAAAHHQADVVTLGEGMLRLTGGQGRRLDGAHRLDVEVAGSELNVAVALASLGLRTRWISALPRSPLGRRVLSDLRSAGVDDGAVRWVDGSRLGLFFVEPGVPPRPTTVFYDRAGSAFGAFGTLRPDDVGGATFGAVSGITPALGPASAALAWDFVQRCAAVGARLCFDVNYRERLWSTDEARAGLAPYLAAADIVVCSETDARRVLGAVGTPSDVLATLRERWAPSAGIVVLTRGLDGVLATDASGVEFEQAALRTVEIDGFGAGDAFVAGLLWGLTQGAAAGDLAAALRAGCTLAALACTVVGDQSRFSADELRSALCGGVGGSVDGSVDGAVDGTPAVVR